MGTSGSIAGAVTLGWWRASGGQGFFWVLLGAGVLLAVILGFIAWAVAESYGPAEPPETPKLEDLARPGHETRDSQPRIVFGFVVILGVTVLFIALASLGVFRDYAERDAARNRPPTPELNMMNQVPPEPRLQTDPTYDLNRFRAQMETRLNSYGWVDQARGVVHIPIQQAMQMVARQGLPAAQGLPSATFSTPVQAPHATSTSAGRPQ